MNWTELVKIARNPAIPIKDRFKAYESLLGQIDWQKRNDGTKREVFRDIDLREIRADLYDKAPDDNLHYWDKKRSVELYRHSQEKAGIKINIEFNR